MTTETDLQNAITSINNLHDVVQTNLNTLTSASTTASTKASEAAASASAAATSASAYIGMPENSQTANYTTVIGDAGKMVVMNGSNLTFTIAANASVAFGVGTVISVVNTNATNLTIAITSDTLTFAGTTTTGSRTLYQNGIATLIKVGTTSWLVTGTGVA